MLACVSGDPAKKGRPKNGLTYSQTISPPLVTSTNRPNEDSQMSVLPFGRRCALPMRGEKKFHAGRSWYFQTISFVAGLTSMARENGIESSRRWAPLSKIKMLPLSSGVGACWPETLGAPSFHRRVSVLREMRSAVELDR